MLHKPMMKFRWFLLLMVIPGIVRAQGSQVAITDISGAFRPITVAVPFVNFAPDSRASAMGDAGVATSPDAYSIHWNNAKLAFIDTNIGFSFSYSPWLGNIVDDMSLNYLTGYKKIDRNQTVALSMRYFDLGEIQLTDLEGESLGIENPREIALDLTYSRKLTQRLSIGATGRFILSNIAGNVTGAPDINPGTSLSVDVGVFYKQPLSLPTLDSDLALGLHVSNIGQKITYTNETNEDFIPANLRLGAAWTAKPNAYHSFTLALDLNKLLVPTPPIYKRLANGRFERDADGNLQIAEGKDPDRPLFSGVFGSFGDAPGGFSEELKEISYSMGAEYWYKNLFAVRTGYFLENKDKGDRKYFTAGLGFRYKAFGLDCSYLIPQEQNHPLGDTLRFSLVFGFGKEEEPTPE